MVKLLKYLFIITGALLLLTTCKKYPEDKFISFSTSKARLEGKWQLERIEINDENIGYKFNDSLTPLTFKDFKFWFKFGVKANNVPGSNAKADLLMINKSSKKEDNALEYPDVSGFDFYLDPKIKTIGISGESTEKRFPIKDGVAHSIFTNLFRASWEVRTLHKKMLIIERVQNNTKHRLHFKKIRNK